MNIEKYKKEPIIINEVKITLYDIIIDNNIKIQESKGKTWLSWADGRHVVRISTHEKTIKEDLLYMVATKCLFNDKDAMVCNAEVFYDIRRKRSMSEYGS